MNKTSFKDNLREIKSNIARFMSILALLFIAAVAFTGIYHGVTMLEDIPEEFFDQSNYEDINIVSTMGLDEKDELVIGTNENVEDYVMSYMVDVYEKDTSTIFRLEMLNDSISIPQLTKGSMVDSYGEIVLDDGLQGKYDIGDTIEFVDEDGSSDIETLRRSEFEVVGFVKSPSYLAKTTNIQSMIQGASVETFAYIHEAAFDMQYYTKALINVGNTSEYYTDTYQDTIRDSIIILEDDFSTRPKEKLEEINQDIDEMIQEAEEEIQSAKDELRSAEDDLDDAYREILQARLEIAQGEKDLLSGKKELDQGRLDYLEGKRRFDDEISSAQSDLDDGQAKLNESYGQLQDAKVQIRDTEQLLDDEANKLASAIVEYNDGKKELDQGKKDLDQGRREYLDGLRTYEEGQSKLQAGIDEYNKGLEDYKKGQRELDYAKTRLQESEAMLKNIQNAGIDIKALPGQISSLQNKVETNTKKAEEFKARAEESGKLAQELETSAKTKAEQAKTGAADSIRAKEEYNQVLESSRDHLKRAEELETQVSKLNTELASLEESLNTLSPEEDPQAYDNLQRQIASKKAQIQETSSSASLARNQGQAAASQAQKKLEQAASLASQVKTLEEQAKADGQKAIERAEEAKTLGDQAMSYGAIAKSSGQELQAIISKLKGLGLDLNSLDTSMAQDPYAELQKARDEISSGQRRLDAAKIELAQGQRDYQAGLEEFKRGQEEFENERIRGLNDLNSSKVELDRGQAEYDKGIRDLRDAKIKLSQGEEDYNQGLETFNEEKDQAYDEISDAQDEIDQVRADQKKLKTPEFMINSRNADQTYFNIKDFPHGLNQLVYVFSILALAVAILVAANNMTRLIDENRTIMGTYKGLGYSAGQISLKFIFFGGVSGLIGAILGSIFGQKILGPVIYDIYMGSIIFEGQRISMDPILTISAIVLAIITTIGVSLGTSYKSLRENTADLLRLKAPKAGNRIFLEKIEPIWSRLSFMNKITARNIFRYKARMFMTILGVGVCMGLLILGLSMKFAIANVVDSQYGQIILYDGLAVLDEDIEEDQLDTLVSDIEEEASLQEIRLENLKLADTDGHNQDVSMYISPHNFGGYIGFQDRDQNQFNLGQDGIVMSEKLAINMDAEEGDTVAIEISGQEYDFKIDKIMKNHVSHRIYLTSSYYESVIGNDMEVNALMVKDTDENTRDFISDHDSIISYIDNNDIKEDTQENVDSLDVVILIIVVISMLLAFVVQYSLTSINVAERKRELSTMKVLGFFPKEITSYVFKETIILSIFGIILGIPIGKVIVDFILGSFAPANLMFGDPNYIISMSISAILTMVFTLIVMFFVHKNLKEIDMLEALSSVE